MQKQALKSCMAITAAAWQAYHSPPARLCFLKTPAQLRA
jgi:hypothetical protein